MDSEYNYLDVAGLSDTGKVRKHNEDSIGFDGKAGWFCVADGMGGEEAGEVASELVVKYITDELSRTPDQAGVNNLLNKDALVSRAIQKANLSIRIFVKKKGLRQSGSTLVCLCFDFEQPGLCSVIHAGDSRVYRLQAGNLERITKDHSVAEAAGVDNEDDIPLMFRGLVTKAVGIKEELEEEVQHIEVLPGDLFLLCSDGLSGMVSDRKIKQILSSSKSSLDERAERLIADANKAGGKDNISAILVQVDPAVEIKPVDVTKFKASTIGEDEELIGLRSEYNSIEEAEVEAVSSDTPPISTSPSRDFIFPSGDPDTAPTGHCDTDSGEPARTGKEPTTRHAISSKPSSWLDFLLGLQRRTLFFVGGALLLGLIIIYLFTLSAKSRRANAVDNGPSTSSYSAPPISDLDPDVDASSADVMSGSDGEEDATELPGDPIDPPAEEEDLLANLIDDLDIGSAAEKGESAPPGLENSEAAKPKGTPPSGVQPAEAPVEVGHTEVSTSNVSAVELTEEPTHLDASHSSTVITNSLKSAVGDSVTPRPSKDGDVPDIKAVIDKDVPESVSETPPTIPRTEQPGIGDGTVGSLGLTPSTPPLPDRVSFEPGEAVAKPKHVRPEEEPKTSDTVTDAPPIVSAVSSGPLSVPADSAVRAEKDRPDTKILKEPIPVVQGPSAEDGRKMTEHHAQAKLAGRWGDLMTFLVTTESSVEEFGLTKEEVSQAKKWMKIWQALSEDPSIHEDVRDKCMRFSNQLAQMGGKRDSLKVDQENHGPLDSSKVDTLCLFISNSLRELPESVGICQKRIATGGSVFVVNRRRVFESLNAFYGLGLVDIEGGFIQAVTELKDVRSVLDGNRQKLAGDLTNIRSLEIVPMEKYSAYTNTVAQTMAAVSKPFVNAVFEHNCRRWRTSIGQAVPDEAVQLHGKGLLKSIQSSFYELERVSENIGVTNMCEVDYEQILLASEQYKSHFKSVQVFWDWYKPFLKTGVPEKR